jgi:hypothetical protein
MSNIVVITSEDLEKQTLRKDNVERSIRYPRDAVDADIMKELLNDGTTSYFINYDGVSVLSRQSDRYPNPTLSHFALAKHLKANKISSPKFIDLGCGVGFLGNYAAKSLGCKEIVFADLNEGAIQQSLFSYQINNDINLKNITQVPHKFGARFTTPLQTLDVRIGNAAESLAHYDAQDCIAVAAPMYLPGICEVFPQAFMFFADVAKKTGAKLYFGHSSLASHMVEQAAHVHNLNLRSREEKEIPFMIEYTDGRKDLIKEDLISLGLVIKNGGKAYHNLMVSELSYHILVVSELSYK